MVLWVLILPVFGAAVALFGSNLPTTLRATFSPRGEGLPSRTPRGAHP
jgi:hypothetical protein